ncbi:alkaline D-peptidase, partial [Bacillus thuringiensis]|nr:alkaline D-peptidase [Bacillus thuringiensis]
GTLGGKHTLVVSLNSLGRDNSPNPFTNILLAEFSK